MWIHPLIDCDEPAALREAAGECFDQGELELCRVMEDDTSL